LLEARPTLENGRVRDILVLALIHRAVVIMKFCTCAVYTSLLFLNDEKSSVTRYFLVVIHLSCRSLKFLFCELVTMALVTHLSPSYCASNVQLTPPTPPVGWLAEGKVWRHSLREALSGCSVCLKETVVGLLVGFVHSAENSEFVCMFGRYLVGLRFICSKLILVVLVFLRW